MKKFLALALCLGTLLLVACSRQTSAAWLVGQWRSEAWDVTYRFEEQSGTWTVTTDADTWSDQASLSEKEGQVILTSPDGTRLVIEKINHDKLTLYQAPADGLVGLTAQVEFERVVE